MILDEDGVYNVAEALLRNARNDYIKGYKYIKSKFHYIPDEDRFYYEYEKFFGKPFTNKKKLFLSDNNLRPERRKWRIMQQYYEARKFFITDPYNIFKKDFGEYICDQLDKDAEEEIRLGI